MNQQFSTAVFGAAIIVVLTIVIATMCLIPGKLGNSDTVAITSARGEAGTVILAQYNPCPGGRCR